MREFSVRMRGRARLARVEVERGGPSSLRGRLAAGCHVAVAITGRQRRLAATPGAALA